MLCIFEKLTTYISKRNCSQDTARLYAWPRLTQAGCCFHSKPASDAITFPLVSGCLSSRSLETALRCAFLPHHESSHCADLSSPALLFAPGIWPMNACDPLLVGAVHMAFQILPLGGTWPQTHSIPTTKLLILGQIISESPFQSWLKTIAFQLKWNRVYKVGAGVNTQAQTEALFPSFLWISWGKHGNHQWPLNKMHIRISSMYPISSITSKVRLKPGGMLIPRYSS